MSSKKEGLICDDVSRKIIETAERIATVSGTDVITVRKILQEMGITNRVFYNRFHNIDEVLEIVYENTILKIRQSMARELDPDRDFFEQVTEIVASTLEMSYRNKMNFNQYVFENDSVSYINYEWWKNEIKRLIEYAKDRGLIRDLDSEIMSYSIWCFIRGYNADAVGRHLPQEVAINNFKYSFGVFLDGMKK